MKPSIGRIVLYHDNSDQIEHPSVITKVWTDTCVNLTVFPDHGVPVFNSSVVQDEEMKQVYGWRWPPRVE